MKASFPHEEVLPMGTTRSTPCATSPHSFPERCSSFKTHALTPPQTKDKYSQPFSFVLKPSPLLPCAPYHLVPSVWRPPQPTSAPPVPTLAPPSPTPSPGAGPVVTPAPSIAAQPVSPTPTGDLQPIGLTALARASGSPTPELSFTKVSIFIDVLATLGVVLLDECVFG